MTSPTDRPPSTKQGKPRSSDEMATILVLARATSQAKAGAEFGVAAKTIGRWEAAIRVGKLAEVALLVREKEAAEARKRADRLDSAYETALTQLEAKLAGASVDQLISATKMLGELRITRDSLDDDELDRADSEGPGVEEASGAAARSEAGSGAKPGSGHQAGTGERTSPIH